MFRSITDWRPTASQQADTAAPGLSSHGLAFASADNGPGNVVPIRHEVTP
ncbi:hypothetical protein [Aminobacter sp. MDW-2]|nr:hypothetical protein [Aminobacter sp. MDW-2]MRX37143.1 hypothetical protein [Aminobacter sp. MDW-2]QNH33306.1 hypothetical protein H5P29_22765 [Aminobacter sp. MDW-2]